MEKIRGSRINNAFEHQATMDQPSENSKLSKKVYLRLMKKYGIEFEGRIAPEKWGNEYTALFHEIRRIGDLRPKEFIEMFHPDDPYLLNTRVKASKLVEGAWNCLRSMDSEQGWRKSVEFPALESFDSAVVWWVLYLVVFIERNSYGRI